MKIIVFSDTHLTDRFDATKFNYLLKIINSADRIIINGDFWDGHLIDFNRFISSSWKLLFPPLLKRQTIYIYGNHDPAEKCDHRVNLFSVKAVEKYVLIQKSKIYHLEHGDHMLETKRSFPLEVYYYLLRQVDATMLDRPIHKLLYLLEQLGYQLIGPSLISNSKIAKRNNLIIKSVHVDKKSFLICGDTHLAEIDKENKYINTGYIGYGISSFCLIDGRHIQLIQETY